MLFIRLKRGSMPEPDQMEVGVYSVLVFLTQRLLWPLTRLGATFDLYQRAMASVNRVFGLLDTDTLIVGGTIAPETIEGDVKIQSVNFAYPEREPIFEDFSMLIPSSSIRRFFMPICIG